MFHVSYYFLYYIFFDIFHDSRNQLWGLLLHLPSNLFYFCIFVCCMCALAFALLAWSLPVAKVAEVIVAVVCSSYCYIADYPATNAITHYPLPIAHCCFGWLLLNWAICLLFENRRVSEWRGANVMRQNGKSMHCSSRNVSWQLSKPIRVAANCGPNLDLP